MTAGTTAGLAAEKVAGGLLEERWCVDACHLV